MKLAWALPILTLGACVAPAGAGAGDAVAPATSEPAQTRHDQEAKALWFQVEGEDRLAYRYGREWSIPHVWPLRSPSGRDLLFQVPDDHPHHRSLWVVDRVQAEGGPEIDFYHEWKNRSDREGPRTDNHSFLRHDRFVRSDGPMTATISWLAHDKLVLVQSLDLAVEELGNGEYFVHLTWEMHSGHSDVHFRSDWVHYAWPYLRMHHDFAGLQGGTITDDQGRTGQEGTNGKHGHWVDYSNTVDGVTEGLAVFLPPDGPAHRWLTREYGTFGPRRADAYDGTGFTLEQGEKLSGQVTILVHRGDVVEGRVAERFAQLQGR